MLIIRNQSRNVNPLIAAICPLNVAKRGDWGLGNWGAVVRPFMKRMRVHSDTDCGQPTGRLAGCVCNGENARQETPPYLLVSGIRKSGKPFDPYILEKRQGAT